jgi:peroxiredoxin
VQTNTEVPADALALSFVDTQGRTYSLEQFRGQKNVVLVFLRGFSGAICPYCTAQTSRLISNYGQFAERDAEVLAVYPGDSAHLGEFLEAARNQSQPPAADMPFPVLLDADFQAVDRLAIRGNLAKPSTFIVDRQGQVRFAYVGAHLSDRPSVKALLAQLDAIEAEQSSSASP